MNSEELAPWLQEIGRRPMPHNAGRPVPPIPHGLKRDKELDERAAGKLEQDFVVRNFLNSTHILNAVSPGWTSAIPFGKYVAEKVASFL